MKRAIIIHRTDFIAILGLVAIAVAVVVYILGHQPSFTLGRRYYTVQAQFATGAAVTAGQGQSLDVAGVQVGEVGGVHLAGGRAVVTMSSMSNMSIPGAQWLTETMKSMSVSVGRTCLIPSGRG